MSNNNLYGIKNIAFISLSGIFITLTTFNLFFTNPSMANGIIEGKVLYFNIVAASFIALYLVFTVASRKSVIRLSAIDITLLAFVLFVTVNYYTKFSFQNDYLFSLLLATAVFFIIKQNAGNTALLILFKGIFLLSGLAQGVYGLFQIAGISESFHMSFPITGTFHNPAPFGIYMAIVFCFSVAEYLFIDPPLSIPEKVFRVISGLSILIVIVVLPSTDSRASWLASLTGLAFLLLIKYKVAVRLSPALKVVLWVVMFGIMIAGGWFLYNYKISSAQGRLAVWRTGMEMIGDAPLTGIGFNQFQYRYPAYQVRFYDENNIDGETINVIDKVDYVFNDYLQVMIENGIIGFLLFLVIIGFIFYQFGSFMNRQRYLSGMYAGMIVILVSAAFSYSFEMISILYVFLLLAAFVSAAQKQVICISVDDILIRAAIGLPAFLFIVLVGGTAIKEYSLRQKWLYASSLIRSDNYNNATILYKEIYEGIPHEKTLLLEYGKSLLLLERYDEGVVVLEEAARYIADPFLSINLAEGYSALGKYGIAEKELLRSISMLPNRIYPRYLLTRLYLQEGDTLKASRYAEKILQMPVKVHSQAIMQMQLELNNIKKIH